jgi:hypothetical protein
VTLSLVRVPPGLVLTTSLPLSITAPSDTNCPREREKKETKSEKTSKLGFPVPSACSRFACAAADDVKSAVSIALQLGAQLSGHQIPVLRNPATMLENVMLL